MKRCHIEKGNKVAEWQDGQVKISIWDGGYAGKTQEELQKVHDGIARVINKIAHAHAAKLEAEAAAQEAEIRPS